MNSRSSRILRLRPAGCGRTRALDTHLRWRYLDVLFSAAALGNRGEPFSSDKDLDYQEMAVLLPAVGPRYSCLGIIHAGFGS